MKTVQKNIKWIVMLACSVLFIKIVENIFENDIENFDYIIYALVSTIIHPFITSIFKIITHFGDWMIMVPICIFSIIFIKKKKYKALIVLNLAIIFVCNQTLKVLFNRPRPTENRLIDASGYSFPSRTFYGKYGLLWTFHIFSI